MKNRFSGVNNALALNSPVDFAQDYVDLGECAEDNNHRDAAAAGTVDSLRRDIVIVCTGPAATVATSSHVGSLDEGQAAATTVTMTADVGCDGDLTSGCSQQRRRQDQVADNCTGNGTPQERDDVPTTFGQPYADGAVLQPYTACFDIENDCRLQDLTVSLTKKFRAYVWQPNCTHLVNHRLRRE